MIENFFLIEVKDSDGIIFRYRSRINYYRDALSTHQR